MKYPKKMIFSYKNINFVHIKLKNGKKHFNPLHFKKVQIDP